MATFDQLSDEQRAIVELVLQQGKSYDELADMLGMPERARARAGTRRARRAGAASAPAASRRTGAASWPTTSSASRPAPRSRYRAATCAARRPPASGRARCSTRSSSSIQNGDLPAIPEGERGRAGAPRRRAPAKPRRAKRSAPPHPGRGRDRRPCCWSVVLVWPVGVLTGGDDDEGRRRLRRRLHGQTSGAGEGASDARRTAPGPGRHRASRGARPSWWSPPPASSRAPSGAPIRSGSTTRPTTASRWERP